MPNSSTIAPSPPTVARTTTSIAPTAPSPSTRNNSPNASPPSRSLMKPARPHSPLRMDQQRRPHPRHQIPLRLSRPPPLRRHRLQRTDQRTGQLHQAPLGPPGRNARSHQRRFIRRASGKDRSCRSRRSPASRRTFSPDLWQLVYDNDYYPQDEGEPRNDGMVWKNPWAGAGATAAHWDNAPQKPSSATTPPRRDRFSSMPAITTPSTPSASTMTFPNSPVPSAAEPSCVLPTCISKPSGPQPQPAAHRSPSRLANHAISFAQSGIPTAFNCPSSIPPLSTTPSPKQQPPDRPSTRTTHTPSPSTTSIAPPASSSMAN